MMKSILVLALVLTAVAPAAAGIIEVPLVAPEAIGVWAGPAVFDLDLVVDPAFVVDVRVRLTGASCGTSYHCGDGPYNWNYYPQYATLLVALGVEVPETASTAATHDFPACDTDPIPFDLELTLPEPEDGWAFLGGENCQLFLDSLEHTFRSPVDLTTCDLADAFTGLETLVLIIETDDSLPSEETSWGMLKARYR